MSFSSSMDKLATKLGDAALGSTSVLKKVKSASTSTTGHVEEKTDDNVDSLAFSFQIKLDVAGGTSSRQLSSADLKGKVRMFAESAST